jgi:hypothetical protein
MTSQINLAPPQRRGVLCSALLTVMATIVLGMSATAVATGNRPVKDGHYVGSVGPGWPISFQVSADGKTVEHLVAGFDEGCNGPAADAPAMFHFGPLPIRNGSFSGHATDNFGKKVSDALRITGSVSGRTAKGKVSDTSHITSLPNCTESSGFTATAR